MENIRTKPHVFLVILDSARKDFFGCYGNSEELTPNIDKLAIYEALTVCDFNIENSINYLYEYNITIV